MTSQRQRVSEILREVDLSDPNQSEELMALVYGELRALAAQHLRRERPDHSWQPTELVHEAYLRLVDGKQVDWKGRGHFFGTAARAMRQLLVDHARRKGAAKRGGGEERVTLEVELVSGERADAELLDLNDALERLTEMDERAGRLVELRFFAGLTLDEAADALGVSRRTAANDWSLARLWLSRELKPS